MAGFLFDSRWVGSGFHDIGGLGSLLGVDDFEFNRVAFCQALEPLSLNGGKVDKYIARAIVFCDETITFLIVKPLYFASHCSSPLMSNMMRKSPNI